MTARLANALYWAFSGLAVVLLLAAVVFSWSDWIDWYTNTGWYGPGYGPENGIIICVLFGGGAVVAWLFGRACHYVLGGDAYALWGRGLIAHARRSPKFRKTVGSVALLLVGGVAWLVLDRQHQQALRKQEYEQQRQAEEREAAQREAARREKEAQRQAEITREAEQREAARRAAVISASDLLFSDVTSQDGLLSGTITNNSRQTLRTMVIEVTEADCPPGHKWLDQGCRIVGQHRQRDVDLNIPPGQARAFAVRHVFSNLPPLDPQRPRGSSWRDVFASSCTWFRERPGAVV